MCKKKRTEHKKVVCVLTSNNVVLVWIDTLVAHQF